ncbi:MAG: FG-GAP repeat protein [Chloroflexi bacterium]|nr:FG-GAP repeat protein [Chloroflexota bacterium]
MKINNNIIFLVFFFAFIGNLNAGVILNTRSSNEHIIVQMNSIPAGVKPGNKPFTLNESFLKKILPELKNPRRMALKDLGTLEEEENFLEGGYTFVLRGDFDGDGFADVAFVGKYDNQTNRENNCFIAVVTIKGKKIIRNFFSKINRDRISLLRVINYGSSGFQVAKGFMLRAPQWK